MSNRCANYKYLLAGGVDVVICYNGRMPTRKTILKPYFAREVDSFKKAFPELQDAVLRYEESDFSGPIMNSVHSVSNGGPTLRCSNPQCHEGGYNLQYLIRLMLLMNVTSKEFSLQCRGWETKSKRSIGNDCLSRVNGTLELKPKPSPQNLAPSVRTDAVTHVRTTAIFCESASRPNSGIARHAALKL